MKRDAVVSIAGKQGPFENVLSVLNQLDLSRINGKSVLIKPNMGRSATVGKGYNTHPQAVDAVIVTLKKAGASEIAIGESPLVGIDVMEAFLKGGITEVAEKHGVKLINFDATPPVKKDVIDGRVLEHTRICSPIYDYDILLSLPVTKTHMHTGVTLGIKNFKGCLYRHEKVRYHQLEYLDKTYPEKTLDSAISDLATLLIPDITVIDGYIGMEGLGPSGGEPVCSDFAVASWHPMGADIFGCLMMGINPKDIPHLRLISERLNFPFSPEDYNVVTENYQQFIHQYKRPPTDISMKFKQVKVHEEDACSSCVSTLMLFLKRFKDNMTPYLLDDGWFHIAIGKGVDDAPEGTVFVGNCTRNNKDKGIYVKGCPPVPTRIYEAIVGSEPDENEPEVN